MSPEPIWQNTGVENHVALLVESYERICGQAFPVSAQKEGLSYALYHDAEHVIVSHGMESDPVFNYANLRAQDLWKMNWEQFTQLPSRLSAKADKVEKRELVLKETLIKGCFFNYEGIRIDAYGKEFFIKNVTLWNLIDAQGTRQGQAALFKRWEYI